MCSRFGKNNHIRLLYCRTRKQRFFERKGTPLFRMKLDQKKAVSLLEHISESCGVRKTGRLVGVNKNTVMRYSRLAGEHAKMLHDELYQFRLIFAPPVIPAKLVPAQAGSAESSLP